MSHEITTTDGLVLTSARAWHGLGTIVENAPTPAEALKIAGLDWNVEQWNLYATNGGTNHGLATERVVIENTVANVRSDTRAVLGLVGEGYTPIQNAELADFCSLLAEQGDAVRVETAGSIRGGAKVWFLLRGESFSVRGRRNADDVLSPYILASNGHDGGTALRLTPTSVRVVCSNTLHMVIPGFEAEAGASFGRRNIAAGFVANHTGDVRHKVEQAKQALELYGRTVERNRELINGLAARDWNSEQVGRFLVQCYASAVEPIPTNPKTEAEERAASKARDAVAGMLARFERESKLVGASAWVAVNAFSGYMQHDRPIRFRDPARVREQRVQAALFGEVATASTHAFALALTI